MPTLQVIVASTRPGRIGRAVGEWFAGEAREHGAFRVELVDLAEVALPLFDEPRHPRLRDDEHAHTQRWSAIVDRLQHLGGAQAPRRSGSRSCQGAAAALDELVRLADVLAPTRTSSAT